MFAFSITNHLKLDLTCQSIKLVHHIRVLEVVLQWYWLIVLLQVYVITLAVLLKLLQFYCYEAVFFDRFNHIFWHLFH